MYTLSSNVTTEKDKAEIRPTEIYDLYLGDQDHPDSDTVKLANYPEDISFFDYPDGTAATYTAWALRRSAVNRTADMEIDSLMIEADNVSETMAGYAAAYDLRGKRLVVRTVFRNLLSAAADAKIIIDGKINSVNFEGNKCQITIVSQLGSLKMKTGRPYSMQCPWRYGYIECNYDFDLFTNQFFEDATADAPDDWTASAGTLSREEKPFPKFRHWGHHIGKFIGDDTNQVYQTVTAATAANTKYYAWLWLRGSAGTETVKLLCYDDVTGTQYATEVTLTTSWKKYVISKTFGNGSTVRRVGVEMTDDGQTIYIDHARLFQVYTVDSGTTATIVDAARTEADDYWNYGWIHFLTGDNAGETRHIVDFVAASDTATLDWVLPNTPAAADEYIIRRGCDKSLDRCENTFSDEDNFGGFHTIPLDKDQE